MAQIWRLPSQRRRPRPADRPTLSRWRQPSQQFESLRSEALLANPLLDFDRLLLVKRADAGQRKPPPRVRGEAGNFVGNDAIGFLNGLPINFQGNGFLRQIALRQRDRRAFARPTRTDGSRRSIGRRSRVFVGDLKLHFDADRLLFSSVGSHGRWQIFEIGVDGQGLRQVTRGEERRRRQLRFLLPARRPDPVRLVGLFPVGPVRAAVRRGRQPLRDATPTARACAASASTRTTTSIRR